MKKIRFIDVVQSKNFRNLLIVAALCLVLAFAIWSWTETRIQFFLNGSKNKVEKIGQIRMVNHDASVNFSGQLIWQPLEQGDFVFVGNSLQTNQESSAEVVLDDGQSLTIGTNSLVRFVKEDGAITLQLVEGKIEIKDEPKLPPAQPAIEFFLKTSQGKVRTKSTHVKVEKKSEKTKLEIVSGTPQSLDNQKPIVSELVIIETKKEDVKKILPETTSIVVKTVVEQKPVENTMVSNQPIEKSEPAQKQDIATIEKPAPAPVEKIQKTVAAKVRAPAKAKEKFLKLPEKIPAKIPLAAPKVKRVDVKVVE